MDFKLTILDWFEIKKADYFNFLFYDDTKENYFYTKPRSLAPKLTSGATIRNVSSILGFVMESTIVAMALTKTMKKNVVVLPSGNVRNACSLLSLLVTALKFLF